MNVGQDFSPADLTELKIYSLDFAALLQAGETLVTVMATLGLVLGTDATPSSHIVGLGAISGSVASQKLQWTGSTLEGNRYTLQLVVTTSLGQTLSAWAYVSIQAPG